MPYSGDEGPDELLRRWYSEHYSTVAATADGSFVGRYMHRALEHGYGAGDTGLDRVLEVGGNRGEHVPFVRHPYAEYVLTDLRPPTVPDALRRDPRLRLEAADVQDLPFDDGRFDRVVATCLMHHVPSPLLALRQMRRVTRPGGRITVLLPADPGIVYRVAKALTSGRQAARRGLSEEHRMVSALDHPNHVGSILVQLRHAFTEDTVRERWLPFRIPSWNANAFVVLDVTVRGAGATSR